MPVTKLRENLDRHHVKYVTVSHSRAYTAQDIAARAHISGKEIAKTVILNVDGGLIMAVLPATHHVDLASVKAAMGARAVRLATEAEFQDSFPACETGAMPPFGNLYGMPVFVDESLLSSPEIAFNNCSHAELLRISYDDFSRLVGPTVFKFSVSARAAAAGVDERGW